MSVTATEIILYAAANMPQDDVSTSGGSIDTSTRIVTTSASLFNALADKLNYVSSNSGDTMNVTVTGRNAAGSIVSETIALSGTTLASGSTVFQSLEKIVIAAAHAGTVTVTKNTGGATVAAIESGVLAIRRLFYGAAADASSGGTQTRYEKFFVKNTDGTNSLLAMQVSETSDPSSVLDFGAAAAVNDSLSVANRKTAPGGITFASTAIGIPGSDLAAGAAIGIWARLTLPAGQAASEYAWGLQVSGSTT